VSSDDQPRAATSGDATVEQAVDSVTSP